MMEFIVLNLDEATEDELISTINCNNRTARLISSEIDKLKKVATSVRKTAIKEQEPKDTQFENITEPRIDEDFENEVDYYYSALKELTLENIEEKLPDVLPSRKNYQYKRILYRIKAEIMKNLKDIIDFLQEEGLILETASDFKEEISLEQKRLTLITERLKEKEETIIQEELPENNNLIFVPTTGGNIRILDEIDHIDADYYERFLGLFQSIKDGTFKNVQRFSRNSDLAGLCEVKDFKTRVIFVRLSKNSYALISAFIKKSDNDKGYRNMLASRYSDYQNIEDSLINNLDNEEFINLHKQYEEELFNKLSPGKKDLPIIKVKVGE